MGKLEDPRKTAEPTYLIYGDGITAGQGCFFIIMMVLIISVFVMIELIR